MRVFAVTALLLSVLVPATARPQSAPPPVSASPGGDAVVVRFAGRPEVVPRVGSRLELMPVLRLLGAEAGYSPAAGTWGVHWAQHEIQFTIGRKLVLVDGELVEGPDAPVASPGGVAASTQFLDRIVLATFGYHLEPFQDGYRIVPGVHLSDPVAIRPAAADFGTTTTLVLTLDRPVKATVTTTEDGMAEVEFTDATPRLDPSLPFRSRRIRTIATDGQAVTVHAADGVGLLSWHVLDGPPRVILELGAVRPTPTPAPVRIVEHAGPPPIVIDAGHGGDDTGAVSPGGLSEKTLTLQVAHRLQRVLEARGHTVRLTRDGDETRALSDRTAFANRLEARAFISLHANSSTVRAVTGAETYYMSLDGATDDAAASIADLENRGADHGGARSPLDLILWDLAQAEVLNESARLALAVQSRLNARLGLEDRGVKQAPFVVLTGATMPAILVEIGFLSNPAEAGHLADADYQQRLAEAIADGIEDFVNRS